MASVGVVEEGEAKGDEEERVVGENEEGGGDFAVEQEDAGWAASGLCTASAGQ
jgi:hypothetical protein